MKWNAAIPHVGAVCRRAREVREITKSAVAGHVDVSDSTILRFERTGKTREERFKAYVSALRRPEAKPPLTNGQAEFLEDLQSASDLREDYEACLATLSYDVLASPNCPRELRELVDELQDESRPAFIADPLYCIHAANEAMLQLFGMTRSSSILSSWEMWHSIGAKFKEDSPVLKAHPHWDEFFPKTMAFYFMEDHVVPHLFTRQMQAVIQRLGAFQTPSGERFRHWWEQVKGLGVDFDMTQLPRTLWYQGRPLQTRAEAFRAVEVELVPEHPVTFVLGGWSPDPNDARTQEIFAELANGTRGSRPVFAKDYDTSRSAHVSTWPEVRNLMST